MSAGFVPEYGTVRNGADERNFHAFHMIAHQQLRPGRITAQDGLVNPVMIIVTTAHVTALEGDDVAMRRRRDLLREA